jgi:hypothetical protein
MVAPVVLGVDVEPDDRGRPPGGVAVDGFHATLEWLEGLRPWLAEATRAPVSFAWYVRMDPQIAWLTGRPDGLARTIMPALERLRRVGDTIGLHTHAGRWDGRRWVADHGDPAWIERCVRTSADAYASLFGGPCREHRFGDRWSGPVLFDALVQTGIAIDLTAEPGQRGLRRLDTTTAATGRIPDYRAAPREPAPYGDGRLWLVPLSSADPGPTLPRLRRVVRRLRYLGQPLHRTLLLDRAWSSAAACWDVAEDRLAEMDQPYLAFAIRSDLLLRSRADGARAVLDELVRRPLAGRLRFTDGDGVVPGARPRIGSCGPARRASGRGGGGRFVAPGRPGDPGSRGRRIDTRAADQLTERLTELAAPIMLVQAVATKGCPARAIGRRPRHRHGRRPHPALDRAPPRVPPRLRLGSHRGDQRRHVHDRHGRRRGDRPR